MKRYEKQSKDSVPTEMPLDWQLGFSEGYIRGYLAARAECLQITDNPIRPINAWGDLSMIITKAMAKRISLMGEEDVPEMLVKEELLGK